jgi:hypothetical protein
MGIYRLNAEDRLRRPPVPLDLNREVKQTGAIFSDASSLAFSLDGAITDNKSESPNVPFHHPKAMKSETVSLLGLLKISEKERDQESVGSPSPLEKYRWSRSASPILF